MTEALNEPDSNITLKNLIEYYGKECKNCFEVSYIDKKKVCCVSVLAAIGLNIVEEEDEDEGDDMIEGIEKGYELLEEG